MLLQKKTSSAAGFFFRNQNPRNTLDICTIDFQRSYPYNRSIIFFAKVSKSNVISVMSLNSAPITNSRRLKKKKWKRQVLWLQTF